MENLVTILTEEKQAKVKGGLYHQTQINLSFNSNRIEGSKLSEEQTRYIFETQSLCASSGETLWVDDIVETVNHFRCFDYMLDSLAQPLSEPVIKTLHFLLKSSTMQSRLSWFNVGEYKQRANKVGNRKTSTPKNVEKDMALLLSRYNSLEHVNFDALTDFHFHFECIHPFQDGNGRVGRLILFRECLRNGITPTIIDAEHKMFYYRGLSEYPEIKGYLTDTLLSAQDNYRRTIREFFPEYK